MQARRLRSLNFPLSTFHFFYKAGEGGFEPPNADSKDPCLAAWRLPMSVESGKRKVNSESLSSFNLPHILGSIYKPGRSAVGKLRSGPVTILDRIE